MCCRAAWRMATILMFSLWPFWSWGECSSRWLHILLHMCVGNVLRDVGEVRCGDTREFVLPPDVLLVIFCIIASKPMEFLVMVMEETVFPDGSIRMRSSTIYKPLAWRSLNAKQASNKPPVKVIDKEDAFCFKPYSYTPRISQSLSSLKRWTRRSTWYLVRHALLAILVSTVLLC